MKKKFLWITTGGTFSSSQSENGLVPDNYSQFILDSIPKLTEKYDIDINELFCIDSTEITLAHQKRLAKEINRNIASYDGIVITHGTDTMAYTASLLCIMLENPPVPVILTGSQLPFTAENTDARKNFMDAFTAAADMRIKTVAVVFDKKIFLGRDCYKKNTLDFNAFSCRHKPLGHITEGSEILLTREIEQGQYCFHPDICDNIAVLKVTPFFNTDIIDYCIEKGMKGIIIEGYGAGNLPEKVCVKLKEAYTCHNIISVLVTQCYKGKIDRSLYKTGINTKESMILAKEYLTTEAALAYLAKKLSENE